MAVSAHGTLLQTGDGGTPEVFTTIAEVLDIEASGSTFEAIPFYGDGGGFPAVVPGDMQPGEITFEVNYTAEASQHAVHAAHADQAPLSLRIVFPTEPASVATLTGYVTGFTFAAPVEGLLRASITITTASAMVMS